MLPLGWDMSTWNVGWGLKLVGRMIAAGAALIWFAFFVEHLTDWFTGPETPPAIVWLAQLAHLGILLGLLASLRWRLTGSLATAASTFLFFGLTVWPPVPVLFVPTMAPALLFLLAWRLERTTNAQRLRA